MVQAKSIKPPLLIVAGPTASGKSKLAVDLALKFNGEVVSCDSMQIYKGLDVGTAKITEKEKRGVVHHLIDVVAPDKDYSVGEYVRSAKTIIYDIISRKKLPILSGGTGLYINALLNNYNFADVAGNEMIRRKYHTFAEEFGNFALYRKLCEIDPLSAEKISPNDLKRIIRALEIYETSGVAKSAATTKTECEYDYLLLILAPTREALYERIGLRVDEMISNGLFEEAESHYDKRDCQSMQAIGYKESMFMFDGLLNKDETIELIKRNTRRYAKRQMTFFKGMKFEKRYLSNYETYIDESSEIIKEKWQFL